MHERIQRIQDIKSRLITSEQCPAQYPYIYDWQIRHRLLPKSLRNTVPMMDTVLDTGDIVVEYFWCIYLVDDQILLCCDRTHCKPHLANKQLKDNYKCTYNKTFQLQLKDEAKSKDYAKLLYVLSQDKLIRAENVKN